MQHQHCQQCPPAREQYYSPHHQYSYPDSRRGVMDHCNPHSISQSPREHYYSPKEHYYSPKEHYYSPKEHYYSPNPHYSYPEQSNRVYSSQKIHLPSPNSTPTYPSSHPSEGITRSVQIIQYNPAPIIRKPEVYEPYSKPAPHLPSPNNTPTNQTFKPADAPPREIQKFSFYSKASFPNQSLHNILNDVLRTDEKQQNKEIEPHKGDWEDLCYSTALPRASKQFAPLNVEPSTTPKSLNSFTCSYVNCGRSYTRLHTLKLHILTVHENIKPYACKYQGCSMSFARNHDLVRHSQVHSGVKKFSCEICDKHFARREHLRSHFQSSRCKRMKSILEQSQTRGHDSYTYSM
ncbi:hypothetical protein BC833DRAFT_618061 [Globomyces pollinis-pini]|nr:hypothetical protein BC833DRAFT_618061 [Globomyces pollinis-pini]